jgi:hypothetical protein
MAASNSDSGIIHRLTRISADFRPRNFLAKPSRQAVHCGRLGESISPSIAPESIGGKLLPSPVSFPTQPASSIASAQRPPRIAQERCGLRRYGGNVGSPSAEGRYIDSTFNGTGFANKPGAFMPICKIYTADAHWLR